MTKLDAIVVTHCHTDHAGGVAALSNHLKVPLYVTPGTQRWLANRKRHETHLFVPGDTLAIGDIQVRSMGLSHDAPDTVALRFELDRRVLALCTDLGETSVRVEALLAGADTILLESNHDPGMLENGPYPAWLKRRIRSRYGHLSNEQCADMLGRLLSFGTRKVVLCHLSETNNTPACALAAMAGLRNRYPDVRWAVAPAHVPARSVFLDEGYDRQLGLAL